MAENILIPSEVKSHPAWQRLENQLNWYSEKSATNKKCYKRFKIAQIGLSIMIPIASILQIQHGQYIVAIFGLLIVLIESIQQLYQFHSLWIEYRSTAESLKHDKYLFLSSSGPYLNLNKEKAMLLLAMHVEEHISKEHAKWINISQKSLEMILDGNLHPAVKQ